MLRTYKELVAWQRGFQLCRAVYDTTRDFPTDERFGLSAQMRRAAVSVPSNIAEGYGRGTTRDYVRFLSNAKGSLSELETQLLIAQDLSYGRPTALTKTLDCLAETERVLSGLIRSLQKKVPR